MFGTYTSSFGSKGEFSLRWHPEQKSKLRGEMKAKLFQELLEMGFDEADIDHVVEKGMSRGEAIEHLTRGPDLVDHSAQPHDNNAGNNNSNNNNSNNVDSLIAMGFGRDKAVEAITLCDGNVERAIEYLMGASN
jgi:Holliday junction resolvasome RuvABC DNA-binding subunit